MTDGITRKVAVISGASRGIGLAIAHELGRRGMSLVLLAPGSERLDRAQASLEKLGLETCAIPTNVALEADVKRAAAQVFETWGVPHVVVANAGILRRGEVHEFPVADWDETLAVNLRGAFLLAHEFVGPMRKQGYGRYLAVASISSTLGTPTMTAYNASKWGMVGLVKSMAEELRGTGVQAMVINPGSTDTDMLAQTPFSPLMKSEDVAKLVAFAALDAPDAMNGAALDIFGP
jgi:3-oxoacyl-[acyl-carrier protein] reductase